MRIAMTMIRKRRSPFHGLDDWGYSWVGKVAVYECPSHFRYPWLSHNIDISELRNFVECKTYGRKVRKLEQPV